MFKVQIWGLGSLCGPRVPALQLQLPSLSHAYTTPWSGNCVMHMMQRKYLAGLDCFWHITPQSSIPAGICYTRALGRSDRPRKFCGAGEHSSATFRPTLTAKYSSAWNRLLRELRLVLLLLATLNKLAFLNCF